MTIEIDRSRHVPAHERRTRSGPTAPPAPPFRLLYVCTGNICRSPFAEILTRHLLIGRLGGRAAGAFRVSSAGVRAVVGSPVHPLTRRELEPWRLDGSRADGFVARQLQPWMVKSADLVLCASRQHRSAVVEETPSALRTAFTLREFARIVHGQDVPRLPVQPVDHARAVVRAARDGRGAFTPVPGADDIADPVDGGSGEHGEAAAAITRAVHATVDALVPRRPGRRRLGEHA